METPKTCRECKYSTRCRSYYGGSLCKHKYAIFRKTMAKINGKKD